VTGAAAIWKCEIVFSRETETRSRLNEIKFVSLLRLLLCRLTVGRNVFNELRLREWRDERAHDERSENCFHQIDPFRRCVFVSEQTRSRG
jgi:hypothetical protein